VLKVREKLAKLCYGTNWHGGVNHASTVLKVREKLAKLCYGTM
jgi:hypothetical protein